MTSHPPDVSSANVCRGLVPILLLALLTVIRPIDAVAGTTFYVDATAGRDSYSGTAPAADGRGIQGPWQTLGRIPRQPLAPGDSVLLKRGGLWRETLTVSSSGAAGAPIAVGAYGSGELPRISGADVVTGWTMSDPRRQIYSAWTPTEPGVVYHAGVRGAQRARADLLTRDSDWFWSAGVLSIRAATSPDSTVEAGVRGSALVIAGQSFIIVQDLVLEHTNGSGLYVDTSDRGSSNLVVQRVITRGSRIAGMTFKNGHPTLKTTSVPITGNTAYDNGSSGINVSEGVNDITISANVVHHNNWSRDIYQAGIRVWANRRDARNLVVEGNEAYANYFTGTGWQNGNGIWLDEVADGAILRYNFVHDNGNVGLLVEHSDRAKVYYNLAVNNGNASILLYRGVHHNQIANNTAYGGATGIRLAGDGAAGSVTGNLVANNISTGPTGQRLMAGDGGENDGVKGSGNVYSHNAFGPARSGFITWGYDVPKSSYVEWEKAYRGPTYSVTSAPGFVGANDFRLRPDSACVEAGINLGLTADITGGAVPAQSPDLGAYQLPRIESPSLRP